MCSTTNCTNISTWNIRQLCSNVLDKRKKCGKKEKGYFFSHCFSDNPLRVNWIMDEIDECWDMEFPHWGLLQNERFSLYTHLSYIWPGLRHRLMGWFRTEEKAPSASGLLPKTWNNLSLFLLSLSLLVHHFEIPPFSIALISVLSMAYFMPFISHFLAVTLRISLLYTFVLRRTFSISISEVQWKSLDWVGPGFQSNHKVKRLISHCYMLPSYFFLESSVACHQQHDIW